MITVSSHWLLEVFSIVFISHCITSSLIFRHAIEMHLIVLQSFCCESYIWCDHGVFEYRQIWRHVMVITVKKKFWYTVYYNVPTRRSRTLSWSDQVVIQVPYISSIGLQSSCRSASFKSCITDSKVLPSPCLSTVLYTADLKSAGMVDSPLQCASNLFCASLTSDYQTSEEGIKVTWHWITRLVRVIHTHNPFTSMVD